MSSSTDLVASDAIYYGNVNLVFLLQKSIPTTKGTETEHMPGCSTDNAMKSNFEKLCKQTELSIVSELHAKMSSFAEKWSQCLLLKLYEKAVGTKLQEFFFFHSWTRPFKHSMFYQNSMYHITIAMVKR